MSLAVTLEALIVGSLRALAHHALSDNEYRTVCNGLGLIESLTDLAAVVSVDGDDMPSPCAVFHRSILIHHITALRRQLDVVRVIEHHKVAESESSRHATCALRNLLLDTSVRDICIDCLLRECRVSCALCKEFCRNRSSNCKYVTLTERTRGILDAAHNVNLWMARSRRAPLTKLLEFLK